MKRIMMMALATVLTSGALFAQDKGCCKAGEACSKECMEMCEKHGCADGKCTKSCKKACKESSNMDCKKGKCCKGMKGEKSAA